MCARNKGIFNEKMPFYLACDLLFLKVANEPLMALSLPKIGGLGVYHLVISADFTLSGAAAKFCPYFHICNLYL